MEDRRREQWVERARRWIEADPDSATRTELQGLVETGDIDALADRLDGELEFGTAGLRGVVGAGSLRMNRAVVIRATRGVADYLLDVACDARTLPVIVGYDARSSSRQFAEATAGVLTAAGIPVRYFEQPVPTPLVGYAVRQLGAAAGIVITASHNPATYNGYKVFGPDGVQIGPPMDVEVTERIRRVGAAADVRCDGGVLDGRSERANPVPVTLFDRYLADVDVYRSAASVREIVIVYTPLHGVGWWFVDAAFRRAGYPPLHVVPEQRDPDGEFPTAPFPNPEEPGVLDRAIALAGEVGADLLLANDPDADRLSICVPTPSRRWVQLSGNQVGLLLADFVLSRVARQPTPLVVSTIVSSPLLEVLAQAHGARCERTLTGFKWICRAGLALQAETAGRFVFGYEEAHGYAIPVVHDKDGISAALLFADLVADCKAAGRSVRERLDDLYREHGLWVSYPKTVVLSGGAGAAQIEVAMERLRSDPPAELGGLPVEGSLDYAVTAERPIWRGVANLVELQLRGGSRVFVRPSGTEPKLKVYTELRAPRGAGKDVREQETLALEDAAAVSNAVVEYVGLV